MAFEAIELHRRITVAALAEVLIAADHAVIFAAGVTLDTAIEAVISGAMPWCVVASRWCLSSSMWFLRMKSVFSTHFSPLAPLSPVSHAAAVRGKHRRRKCQRNDEQQQPFADIGMPAPGLASFRLTPHTSPLMPHALLSQPHLDVAGGTHVAADMAADTARVIGVHVAPGGGFRLLTLNTAFCGQYTTQLSHSKHRPQLMQRFASATTSGSARHSSRSCNSRVPVPSSA